MVNLGAGERVLFLFWVLGEEVRMNGYEGGDIGERSLGFGSAGG